MSDAIYADMQAIATDVLTEFSQGEVILRRRVKSASNPTTPWQPGQEVQPEDYPLNATVRRVMQKYVDGTTILATDDQIVFAVPDIEPKKTDVFLIDGQPRVLKDLRPIPAAGEVVAYIAFVGS